MALVSSSIAELRDTINEASSKRSIIEDMNSNYDHLNWDENYSKFVFGTGRGKELDEKLKKLYDLIGYLDSNEISVLIKTCTVFLETQEHLNN